MWDARHQNIGVSERGVDLREPESVGDLGGVVCQKVLCRVSTPCCHLLGVRGRTVIAHRVGS